MLIANNLSRLSDSQIKDMQDKFIVMLNIYTRLQRSDPLKAEYLQWTFQLRQTKGFEKDIVYDGKKMKHSREEQKKLNSFI